jgi:hypothetical protein
LSIIGKRMMFKLGIFILLLSLLEKVSASTTEMLSKPRFSISHGAGVERQAYIKLIQTIYEELGFEVSFIAAPAKRGIMLLNDNVVDADVIRLKPTVVKYDNVILVEPALAKGSLMLFCHKNVPCELSVLHSKTTQIQTHRGILNQFEPGELKAQILLSEMPKNTLNMLQESRVFYALSTVDEPELEALSNKFNYVKIKDVFGYHVIHKKHAYLLPKIQQKLRQKIPAFTASGN